VLDVATLRLRNERLIGAPLARCEDVVQWLGAVQAQDYAGAKWALAQRSRTKSDGAIEEAFAAGRFVRTHVMRPTWHFVMPADVRWMQMLTAPRVRAAMAYYDRKLDIDERTVRRSNAALARALEGGKCQTREELARALGDAGIAASGQRLGHLMMHAELDSVVCSGPRRGKQFTYALLDERCPATPTLSRDEALAELSSRYFASHGPASLQDFAWWSGLTVSDARNGVALCRGRLVEQIVDAKRYWLDPTRARASPYKMPMVHLLPNYDEYLIAYKDHGSAFDPKVLKQLTPMGTLLSNHIVVMNGRVIGGWRRTTAKGTLVLEGRLLVELGRSETRALRAAVDAYGRFLGMPARWVRITTWGASASR
jgi:hypothetical protein